MKIQELIKLCAEYIRNLTKKKLLEYDVDSNRKYSHLSWAIERDMESLMVLCNRQVEIQEELTDLCNIEF